MIFILTFKNIFSFIVGIGTVKFIENVCLYIFVGLVLVNMMQHIFTRFRNLTQKRSNDAVLYLSIF